MGRTKLCDAGSFRSRRDPMIGVANGGTTSTRSYAAPACDCVQATIEWLVSSSTRTPSVKSFAGTRPRSPTSAKLPGTGTTFSCAPSSKPFGGSTMTGRCGWRRPSCGRESDVGTGTRRCRLVDRRFHKATESHTGDKQHRRLHRPRRPARRLDRRSCAVGYPRCHRRIDAVDLADLRFRRGLRSDANSAAERWRRCGVSELLPDLDHGLDSLKHEVLPPGSTPCHEDRFRASASSLTLVIPRGRARWGAEASRVTRSCRR